MWHHVTSRGIMWPPLPYSCGVWWNKVWSVETAASSATRTARTGWLWTVARGGTRQRGRRRAGCRAPSLSLCRLMGRAMRTSSVRAWNSGCLGQRRCVCTCVCVCVCVCMYVCVCVCVRKGNSKQRGRRRRVYVRSTHICCILDCSVQCSTPSPLPLPSLPPPLPLPSHMLQARDALAAEVTDLKRENAELRAQVNGPSNMLHDVTMWHTVTLWLSHDHHQYFHMTVMWWLCQMTICVT